MVLDDVLDEVNIPHGDIDTNDLMSYLAMYDEIVDEVNEVIAVRPYVLINYLSHRIGDNYIKMLNLLARLFAPYVKDNLDEDIGWLNIFIKENYIKVKPLNKNELLTIVKHIETLAQEEFLNETYFLGGCKEDPFTMYFVEVTFKD